MNKKKWSLNSMTSSYESDLNIEDVIKNIKVDDMDYIFESS